VLPDLVKNAQKDANLYPTKIRERFEGAAGQLSLLNGWERHLETDRIFHSSEFFDFYTNELKLLIVEACEGGPVKPFFLAHIGLELMLDHFLVADGLVSVGRFYEQLSLADKPSLEAFLLKSGMEDRSVFLTFLDSFISSRYLLSYQKVENITYALNRICMRLWANPFSEPKQEMLTRRLEEFKVFIRKDYFSIFSSMEKQLR
jgi:hypothetical protein